MKYFLAVLTAIALAGTSAYADDKVCDDQTVEEGTIASISDALGVKAVQDHKDHFTTPSPKKGKTIPWTLKDDRDAAEFIEDIMRMKGSARHDQGKTKLDVVSRDNLTDGRVAWWEDKTGTLVIFTPGKQECGTAYRPDKGKTEYTKLT